MRLWVTVLSTPAAGRLLVHGSSSTRLGSQISGRRCGGSRICLLRALVRVCFPLGFLPEAVSYVRTAWFWCSVRTMRMGGGCCDNANFFKVAVWTRRLLFSVTIILTSQVPMRTEAMLTSATCGSSGYLNVDCVRGGGGGGIVYLVRWRSKSCTVEDKGEVSGLVNDIFGAVMVSTDKDFDLRQNYRVGDGVDLVSATSGVLLCLLWLPKWLCISVSVLGMSRCCNFFFESS